MKQPWDRQVIPFAKEGQRFAAAAPEIAPATQRLQVTLGKSFDPTRDAGLLEEAFETKRLEVFDSNPPLFPSRPEFAIDSAIQGVQLGIESVPRRSQRFRQGAGFGAIVIEQDAVGIETQPRVLLRGK
ncbi:MAG: hypothetical protein KatS3mg132_915 [Limisphaera sp.]|nr:MAG: hypothetical protein KatS3mg132_915 [Limisphaera sp.]